MPTSVSDSVVSLFPSLAPAAGFLSRLSSHLIFGVLQPTLNLGAASKEELDVLYLCTANYLLVDPEAAATIWPFLLSRLLSRPTNRLEGSPIGALLAANVCRVLTWLMHNNIEKNRVSNGRLSGDESLLARAMLNAVHMIHAQECVFSDSVVSFCQLSFFPRKTCSGRSCSSFIARTTSCSR